VARITPPLRAIELEPNLKGIYTSEGVSASNATAWHTAGKTGAGVRIAVIDAGFDGYASLLGSDLPTTDKVKTYDWTSSGMGGSPHGTACAEIVHDMAPGATLYLHKVNFATHLGQAVDQAIADGVSVISMSLGWTIDGPGDGTGFLANIVKKARQNGILFVTAAGNEADETWHGIFQDDGSGRHRWPSGDWVNELTFFINAGDVIRLGLHWDDWTSPSQDYDLELYRWTGSSWSLVASSRNRQSSGYPTPEEWIGMYAPENGRYGVAVRRHSATRNVCFRVLAPKMGALQDFSSERSVTFPADSTDAVSAGALDVDLPYNLESYSSRGPTFGAGGACIGGTIKPDLGGYANVSTVSYGPRFFNGTSSATPHVAGAAALVWGTNPAYSPGQVQSFLEQRALDQGPAGKDNRYGWGRLYLGDPSGGINTPPSIAGLPDQTLPMNTSRPQAIDLWAYASDAESADSALTYSIDNSPDPDAGVSIQNNRYVSIQPTNGWTGQTGVTIKVTDPGSLSDSDALTVTVMAVGKVWNGSQSDDWHAASNWSPSGVPASDDDVTIPKTSRDPVVSTDDAAANNLRTERGAVLDLGTRELTVEGLLTNEGTLVQTQSVQDGKTTQFLRIMDQSGNETKYYGLDITPTNTTNASIFAETAAATSVTVAVAGEQYCAGRASGVKRCYEVESSSQLEATVRFYFREAERNGMWVDDLKAYRLAGDWLQEPGPYSRGDEDPTEGIYVQAQKVDEFSRFALDTRADGRSVIYMPFINRQEPQVPQVPFLNPISNLDGDGNFAVTWLGSPGASTYTLQEDDNIFFTSPAMRYAGPSLSWSAKGMLKGRYYYRVNASNISGSSGWSSPQSVQVREDPLETVFYAVEDAGVYQGMPQESFGPQGDMWTGYGLAECGSPTDYQISRSLVKFDLGGIPSVMPIASARLYVRTYGLCYRPPTNPRSVTVYRTASDWSELSVTWDSQPALGEAYGSASIPFEAGEWHSFDVTGLAQGWIDLSVPNHGLVLRGPEGTGSNLAWIGFFSSESASRPYIKVTYPSSVARTTNEEGLEELSPGTTGTVSPEPAGPYLVPSCTASGSGAIRVTCAAE
jgi:subtilisin family serine protease